MTRKSEASTGRAEPVATNTSVRIARQLELDRRAATQKFGIIGRSEAGQTYLAGRLVEQLHAIGCQVIILDPVGVWWGLTLAANGKDAGLPFVVFGGRRGHLPLKADNGRRIARAVVEQSLSAVIDLTGLRKRRRPGGRASEPESELHRFLADFQEEALDASQREPKARMVVYDEAQMMLPQVVSSGGERMLGTGEDLVRTGRNSGWGFVLMSQRPQSINKEVLSQVECFFVGQLTEPHARNRLKEWIVEKKADVRSELDELVKLERGEFYVWSPQWLQTFKKVRVLPKWTFDASRTPELGDLLVPGAPKQSSISARDLEALRRSLEDGDDPAEPRMAKQDGGQLERERELRRRAERRAEQAEASERALREGLGQLQRRIGELMTGTLSAEPEAPAVAKAAPAEDQAAALDQRGHKKKGTRRAAADRASPVADGKTPARTTPAGTAPRAGLDKCQRAILGALIQHGGPMPHARLARITGYPVRTSSIKNGLSKLRTANYVEGGGATVTVTALGVRALEELGGVPALPKGAAALFEYWMHDRRVKKCMRAILVALRPLKRGVRTEELAALTGYPTDTSSVKNALSDLRTLGLIEGRGVVALAEELRA